MNTPADPRPGHDEEYPELSALYRQARAIAPPLHLDSAILGAARAAVTPVRRRAAPRWSVPLALAASLVLGVGLVHLVQREAPHGFAPVRQPAFQPGNALEQGRASAPDSLQPEAAAHNEIAPVPSAPAAAPASPNVALRRAEPASAVSADTRADDAITAPAAPSPAKPVAPADTPTPPPAAAEAGKQPSSANARGDAQTRGQTGATTAPEGKISARTDAGGAAKTRLSAEDWLKKIIELRRQGRDAEANRELAAFRRQYPHHPIPAAAKAG
ncbi:MAG: hypothetical protein U1F68_03305 [Gammaproteobacteria bacterium]